jgi:hypothetical protein
MGVGLPFWLRRKMHSIHVLLSIYDPKGLTLWIITRVGVLPSVACRVPMQSQ